MEYVKEWQQALQIEINHLKKYGSTKYRVKNGQQISATTKNFTYRIEVLSEIVIPVGANIRIQWGSQVYTGKILSSEQRSLFISLEKSLGDLFDEAILLHDPWELLEELCLRLDESMKSKRKRNRIHQLMEPTISPKHPIEKNKSNSHELFFRSQYNPATFVWGPPGTGKTYTLARVAANKYFQGKRVLILSQSNQAVDVLVQEIVQFLTKKSRFTEGDVLRYGIGSKQLMLESITTMSLLEKREPKLAKEQEVIRKQKKLLNADLTQSFSRRDSESLLAMERKLASIIEKVRQKELGFLKEAKIIGTTLAKAATDGAIYEKDFDIVIIDEASMAYVPQVAFASALGKRVIVSGDFKQLPPIAAARHSLVDKWLREDIFHRAGVVDGRQTGVLHPHLMLLNEQRRMHPDVSAFTNEHIYRSKVFDHPSMEKKRRELAALPPFSTIANVLVDTSYTGQYCIQEKASKSRLNLWHLFLSFQLVHEAAVGGAKSIGYVTPYRAQAQLMEVLLKEFYENELQLGQIQAATVHRFQGSERDVMIFDTVDGYPQERASMLLTGKDSERLVNVAITRTKGKFIHVSNRTFVKNTMYPGKTIRQLVEHQEKNNKVITHQQIGAWINHQQPKFRWVHALKLDQVIQDLNRANSSVFISLPDRAELSPEWLDAVETLSHKVLVTFHSKHRLPIKRRVTYLTETLPFPCVIIDQKLLWLGHPLQKNQHVNPPYVAVRLDSRNFVEFLVGQIV
ncbi:DNA helicase [Anaerobacillus alkaliphilus]|uniref:DNA helicase n=1 Tax=Anaerobacillus alkaliphilus TaxID=1548597 RepID=A0A4Q0VLH8_9BACI|nr:AAA domain-containing protein [Anaerobacillus alkaliphilus]RXI95536.1 DNA helicase [Anaerobacillus alkaliphilus]